MFVSFVSSGPGDPELLTLKAVDRIKSADVILYDDLSSGEILRFASPNADLIGVGKRAGRASPKQGHVSQLLLDYAKTNVKTVRLKSGDAGIFGRLEEEITVLNEAGIDFEIIPGVPSAIAAAASAKIPLTRRLLSRRLQFITGHDVNAMLPDDINWGALADPHTTTALFMGKRTFSELAEKLIAQGLAGTQPVLFAENVSKPNEKLHFSTLQELSQSFDPLANDAPAIFLIGPLLGQ